jgi:hypothetical protein
MKIPSFFVLALSTLPISLHAASEDKVPTFAEDIAPLVFAKCAVCHRDGQVAPFSLNTYEQVKKRAKDIAEVTGEHTMPPWHADRGVIEYANDRSLSDAQIALVKRWVDGGAPQGDASKTPPLPKFPEGWELGEPSFVAEMPEAFTVPAEGRDMYRNFVIPLNRDEDTWINGIEYKPGAPAAVHHVLYYLDTEGKARERDAADPLPGYNGMGRSNGNFRYLGGWDLGTQPSKVGYDLAWLVPKGADLVIQVHYHPSGKEHLDKAKLGFHIAKKPTARPWSIVPVPPFFGILSGIKIPAGEKEYIKESSMVLPVDIEAIAVNAHAHYLGKRMEMSATLPDGTKQVLLKMSDWHFAWQEDYAFKQPIKLPAGTRLHSLISWDNTDANPHQTNHPPKDVRWGPRSEDEMGTITLTVMMNTAEEKAKLHTELKRSLTAQFIQRAFENDVASMATVKTQIESDVKGVPDPKRLSFLQGVLANLDKNKDGKLDDEEIKPAIDFVTPAMKGFGQIGFD